MCCKIRSEVILEKSGLKSLTEAVSITMATRIWKARNELNQLGLIFQKKPTLRTTRSVNSNNLCQPVPGHPELAANKLAQVWNVMNLSKAKSVRCAKTSAKNWYKQSAKPMII